MAFFCQIIKIQKEETGYEIFKIFTGCQHVCDDAFSAPVANAGILQCQTVEAAVSKTSKLNKTTANLTLGKGIQLSLSNAVSSKIMWKVSSPTILGVTQRGYVTGLKAGSAYVYATYKGRTYKCKVTVKVICQRFS